MKKVISLILCLALLLGFASAASADSYDDERVFIKVGLFYQSSALHFITFYCDDGFIIADYDRRGFTESYDLRDYTKLVVKEEGGSVNIYDGSDNLVYEAISRSEALMSAADEPDRRIVNAAGTKYRDGFVFGSYGGSMAVANYLSLEHYLWGMLSREMPYTYQSEALKAQSLAARSYALRNLNRHTGGALDFDVCATTHCQVYGGCSAEHTSTTNACLDTSGEIVVYDGKVADTVFFANSFGYTLNSEDFWGTNLPYLRGVDDSYTTEHKWQTKFTFDEISSRLRAYGYNVGSVQSVYIGERNPNGSVRTIVIKGSSGTARISKALIQTVFNLKSIAFSIAPDGYPGGLISGSTGGSGGSSAGSDPVYELTVSGLDSSSSQSEGIYVIGADGEPVYVALADVFIENGSGVSVFEPSETEEPEEEEYDFSTDDQVCDSGMVYMTGYGYGHCVGMCQTGAGNMAKDGYTYDEIIKHYYTGVGIEDMSVIGF